MVSEAPEPSREGPPAADPRVPVWAWVAVGVLSGVLLAVSVGLALQARESADDARAAKASATQLLDTLVADVEVTNDQVATLNAQLEKVSSAAASKAESAKKKQASRQSGGGG